MEVHVTCEVIPLIRTDIDIAPFRSLTLTLPLTREMTILVAEVTRALAGSIFGRGNSLLDLPFTSRSVNNSIIF